MDKAAPIKAGSDRPAGRRRRRFFTLAEVIIAGAILALVATGVFTSVLMAQFLISNAREHQAAESLAMDKVWEIFNLPYQQIENSPNPLAMQIAVPQSSILYNWGGTIRTAVTKQADYCEIMVRVDWNGRTITHQASPSFELLTVDRYRDTFGQ